MTMKTTIALALAASVTLGACGRGDDGNVVLRDTATYGGAAAGTMDGALRVTDLSLGRTVGSDNRISDETDDFKPNDTIIAVVETDGNASGQTLVARWTYEDGQVVEEQTQTVSATGGKAYTQFRLSKASGWPTGKYHVRIYMNNNEVESEEFEVKR
jgi:hypothetical protein